MANAYDPYREALVVEELTIWPEDYDNWDEAERQRVGAQLHASPQEAADLDYVGLHPGVCRQITVTADDLERVK
jgi:hypothetical protein